MQTSIIIVNLILSIIGWGCIDLKTYKNNKFNSRIIKNVICCGIGSGALIFVLFVRPFAFENIVLFILLGALSGEILLLFYLIVQGVYEENIRAKCFDDGTPANFFITGDKHRNFTNVRQFCRDMNTRKKDVLIVLGDAGFNYFEDDRDKKLKEEVCNLNITLFCLHGNKEKRPQNIDTYGIRSFYGGKVFYEPKYPNILFAIDGEIYTFNEKKYIVIGGAHSVDKIRCIEENKPFWNDEMPDDLIKSKVENRLIEENNGIYGVLTHTCPISYLPTEMFISTRENSVYKKKTKNQKKYKLDIDRSTEKWLGELEKKINYEVWYCGHYHVDKEIDNMVMMYQNITPLT